MTGATEFEKEGIRVPDIMLSLVVTLKRKDHEDPPADPVGKRKKKKTKSSRASSSTHIRGGSPSAGEGSSSRAKASDADKFPSSPALVRPASSSLPSAIPTNVSPGHESLSEHGVFVHCGACIEVKRGEDRPVQRQPVRRQSLAQGLMFTLTLNEQCGTWLGISVANVSFCRVVVVELRRFVEADDDGPPRPVLAAVIETKHDKLIGQCLTIDRLLAIDSHATSDNRMPPPFLHSLNTLDGFKLFLKTVRAGYEVLGDQRLDEPLRKLRPQGPTWDAVRIPLERDWDQRRNDREVSFRRRPDSHSSSPG